VRSTRGFETAKICRRSLHGSRNVRDECSSCAHCQASIPRCPEPAASTALSPIVETFHWHIPWWPCQVCLPN